MANDFRPTEKRELDYLSKSRIRQATSFSLPYSFCGMENRLYRSICPTLKLPREYLRSDMLKIPKRNQTHYNEPTFNSNHSKVLVMPLKMCGTQITTFGRNMLVTFHAQVIQTMLQV